MTIDHSLMMVAGLLARNAIHHFYHKACHHMVHAAGHKVHFVGYLLTRCKWLMDAILVGCLAVFGFATEHSEHETDVEK